MVVFTCQNCGDSLKKTAVDKHYNTKCCFQRPNLTCVDCLKDFFDQDYSSHTECITEAERYSAKGTVFKVKAGKAKQQKYVNMIQNLLNSKDLTKAQAQLLYCISKYNNVPRKESKFLNFMKNINKQSKLSDLQSVFKLIQGAWADEDKKNKEPVAAHKDSLVSENTVDEPDVLNDSCDNSKNETNKSLDAGENLTKTNGTINESEENMHKMSKKERKKQKKHQKYLLELENVEKDNVNKENYNVDCPMESEESLNEKCDKTIKKSKKNKAKTNQTNYENGAEVEKNEAMEQKVSLREESVSKKHKKRKLVDTTPEIAEKKNKLDAVEAEKETQQTFNWAEVIVKVLQSRPDHELSLKKLGKKVVNEYQNLKSDHHTYEELLGKFNKKVKKTSGVRVLKDKAKLIE